MKGGRPFLGVGNAEPEAIVRIATANSETSAQDSPAQIPSLVDELEAQQRTLPSIQTVFVGGTMLPPE